MRRVLSVLLKVLVSALLFYVSVRSVNFTIVIERLSHLEAAWIIAALMGLAAHVGLIALRWREIAAVCGAPMAVAPAVQITYIANFFNQALPSTVGGDAARIWLLVRRGAGLAAATYSVLIDRVAGLLILALIVVACLPWTFTLIHDPLARAVLLMISLGAVVGALVFVFIGVYRWPLLDRTLLTRHLAETSRMAWRLVRSGRSVAIVALYSFTIQALLVVSAWCCVKAMSAPVGFAPILLLLPPVLLISTIPISIAGWGVRESAMVAAFAYAGLPEGDGLALSILFGVAMLVVGVIGGFVWVVSGHKLRPTAQTPGTSSEIASRTAHLLMERN